MESRSARPGRCNVPIVSEIAASRGVESDSGQRGVGTSSGGAQPSAVIDLLAMLAFAELLAFDRMAADARLAPDLRRRARLSEMAGREISSYSRLAARLSC